jgi:hypothetical protein
MQTPKAHAHACTLAQQRGGLLEIPTMYNNTKPHGAPNLERTSKAYVGDTVVNFWLHSAASAIFFWP